jgi:peroxiredoxin/nitrous oxide reductase accessory protein NosL
MRPFLYLAHRRLALSGIPFRLLLTACIILPVLFGTVDLFAAKRGIDPGDQAYDFTLRDANGVSHTLGTYRGDVVVLYFAMWCTTCRANTLELQREIYLPLKDLHVRVFAVDYLGNKYEEIRSIIKDIGLAYPVLLDDRTLTDRYGEKMSITLVIDRNGVIRYRDFYDFKKVKAAVAKAAGVSLDSPYLSPKQLKKEPRPARPLPQQTSFIQKQVFYGSSEQEYFGFAVSPGPVDINSDGIPDALIGTPSAENDTGAVFIRYGRKNGFPENPDMVLAGEKPGEKFGGNLLVTDVNNDGLPDLVTAGSMSRQGRGRVSIFFNSKNGLSRKPEHEIEDGAAGGWFGSSIAAGDLNRDGYADLAVSAFNEAGKGAVHLYYGKRKETFIKTEMVLGGKSAHDDFGSALCVADMDHDGFDDLMVSATGVNGQGTDRGAVYVFFGGRKGTAPEADIIIEGESDMDGFGSALSCQSDLDKNGSLDLVIGASASSKAGKWAGAVTVFFGPLVKDSSGARVVNAADAHLTLTHGEIGSMYGVCLAGLGDVNGDGIDDIAVGAMNAQLQPERAGAVYIYYGCRERKLTAHEVIYGTRKDGRFGRGVFSLGSMGFLVSETGNSDKVNQNGAVRFFAARAAPPKETECSVCGMMLSKYRHTRFEITTQKGARYATCGVQCGLVLILRRKESFLSAKATDFISGRSENAAEMFYVYKSEAVPDMWPSFIAFRAKNDAEKFCKGFGGMVLDYGQALKKAALIR